MVQAYWYRAFGLAAIALMLCGLLVAQAVDTESIEQKLNAEFIPTRISADRLDVVTPGTRVAIQKPGLTMYDVASPMPPLYTYKNGKIGRGLTGFGKDFKISLKTPGGTSADYLHRPFALGEKCWVTEVQIQRDGVLFQLYSDRYEETRYYAELMIAFPKKKEMPQKDVVLQLIAEVLTVAPGEVPVEKPVAQAPAPPVVSAAAKTPSVNVSGRYIFDEGDSQLRFAPSGACIMVGPGGSQSAGKYSVSGDALTINCTMTGSSINLKIGGAKLVAGDGHAWLWDAAAPPLPPSISAGQSKAQVIATFGQPVKSTKIGAKEIFYYKDLKVTFLNGKVSSFE